MSSLLLLSMMMKRTHAFTSLLAHTVRQQQPTTTTTRAVLPALAVGSGGSNSNSDRSTQRQRRRHAHSSPASHWFWTDGHPNSCSSTISKSSRNNNNSYSSTRLYSFSRFGGGGDNGNNNNDDDKNQGFLTKLKNKAKQYLPFLRTEEEQQAAMAKHRVKSDVQSSIQQVLRDAPLPIRAMGGLVGSLLGSVVSELAQAASQQNGLIDRYYSQAVTALTTNAAVQAALGGSPVQVGPITSQSSSTTSINGQSMTRVQLGFAVYGGRGGAGQARLSVQTTTNTLNNDSRDPPPTLQVQLNTGQVLSVPMDGRRSSSSSSFGQRFSSSNPFSNNKINQDDDTVIEAEIIDKKPSR